MNVAIYARVSTRRQERDQTIDGQLAALREWAAAAGHDLRPEYTFTDPGHSGGRLDRPGLDLLRDAAAGGRFDAVGVFSPDRLARRYIHQAILLEEFRKAGCPVTFVHRPISDDPHDQLLLQIQGAVAEYERSVIADRFRRGKLQRARAGYWVAGRAPYGYRYVPKRDGVPGYLLLDESEAEVIKTIYRWLLDERLSLRGIALRMADGPWRTRSGGRFWSGAVLHRILSDPMYAGTAYANRFVMTASADPMRRARRPGALTCRRERPREDWVPIPVPAIVDEPTHVQAVAQLASNAAKSRRNSFRFYLLRCLLGCGQCGRGADRREPPCRGRAAAVLQVLRARPEVPEVRGPVPAPVAQGRAPGRRGLGTRLRTSRRPGVTAVSVRRAGRRGGGRRDGGPGRGGEVGIAVAAAGPGGGPLGRRLPV